MTKDASSIHKRKKWKWTKCPSLVEWSEWMEEPGGLQSMGTLSRTQLSDFTFTFHFHALEKEMATHSSVLAWRIPGTGEPGGLSSMGSHRVRHDWSDLAAAVAVEWSNKPWCMCLMEYYSVCTFHISVYHMVVICWKNVVKVKIMETVHGKKYMVCCGNNKRQNEVLCIWLHLWKVRIHEYMDSKWTQDSKMKRFAVGLVVCGRKWRRTKEPLDKNERGEWKSWLKAQHSKN